MDVLLMNVMVDFCSAQVELEEEVKACRQHNEHLIFSHAVALLELQTQQSYMAVVSIDLRSICRPDAWKAKLAVLSICGVCRIWASLCCCLLNVDLFDVRSLQLLARDLAQWTLAQLRLLRLCDLLSSLP